VFRREIYCDRISKAVIFTAIAESMSAKFSKNTLTLAGAKVGEKLRVVSICPDCPECMRLRELGFYDSAELRKISDGAAIICSLLGMRVAIGRDLGEHVRVERIAA
jgi:Fe2+ transport system protein FeoA